MESHIYFFRRITLVSFWKVLRAGRTWNYRKTIFGSYGVINQGERWPPAKSKTGLQRRGDAEG